MNNESNVKRVFDLVQGQINDNHISDILQEGGTGTAELVVSMPKVEIPNLDIVEICRKLGQELTNVYTFDSVLEHDDALRFTFSE